MLDETRPRSGSNNCCRATDHAATRLHASQTISFDDERIDVCSSDHSHAKVADAVCQRAEKSSILDLNVLWKAQCAERLIRRCKAPGRVLPAALSSSIGKTCATLQVVPFFDLFLIVAVEREIESSGCIELNVYSGFFVQSGSEMPRRDRDCDRQV